jgi:N-methylhydantoinase A
LAQVELARGIIRVANQHMAKALQAVRMERGMAPRDFTLCCFGGAAGPHVCELARELEVRRLLLPAQAGVLSALVLAQAGFRRDFARTLLLSGPSLTWERLQMAYNDLRREALEELAADGLEVGALTRSGELELRYPGQSYTLSLPLNPQFREAFKQSHLVLYGHNFLEPHLEAVVLRLHAVDPVPAGRLPSFTSPASIPKDFPP